MRIFVKEGFTLTKLNGATVSYPKGFYYDLEDEIASEYVLGGKVLTATEDNEVIESLELPQDLEPLPEPQESGAGGDIEEADLQSDASEPQESGAGGAVLDHDAFTSLEAPQESGAGGDILLLDTEVLDDA